MRKWWTIDANIYILDVPGSPGKAIAIIFVTSLSNKRYSYHYWLLVITNLEKREKSNKFNRFQIEVFFLPNIGPLVSKSPLPTEYRPIKFALCMYMRPGHINGILRYCFYMKTKITVDFHICISVPLRII